MGQREAHMAQRMQVVSSFIITAPSWSSSSAAISRISGPNSSTALVVVSSVFYGRVFCGYLCPQMIFSEASLAVESYLRRKVDKKLFRSGPKVRARIARALWLAVVAVGSVFAAFVFMTYFVEPRDLLHRLLSFDLRTASGLSGAVVTLVAMADFSLVRLRFCTSVCPYGYLPGMLGDADTLLVRYSDPKGDCIECKKCVRMCPMGIDIRESPFQIECVHCAECIDACDQVLVRLGKAGLVRYAWGDKGAPRRFGAKPRDCAAGAAGLCVGAVRGSFHAPPGDGAHLAGARRKLVPHRRGGARV